MAVREKMSRADRAKQFMPFAALRGYEEELSKVERVVVPRMELTDDYADVIDRVLKVIKQNDMVTAVYYSDDDYVKVTGMVSCIDYDKMTITIVNETIRFRDLCSVEIEK